MTFLRAKQAEHIPDEELARLRERLAEALTSGRTEVLLPPGVLGYAVAHTIHGRTALTHTTPMDHGEAVHELRQCRQRGGIYALIELRQGGE